MAASKVTDLRKRHIERLADEIEPYLRSGHAIVDVERIPSADEWRAAACLVVAPLADLATNRRHRL